VPAIVGGDVFAGATPWTTAVAFEVADVAPAEFLAVTFTRTVAPTSAAVTMYV
jgi:hypothetical protein